MKYSVTKTVLAALAAGFSSVAAAQAQVSCGAVVSTKVVMTGDLACLFDDPAFTIDGGEVDMNGHRVGCLPGQDGVAMINSGGKLRNGSIDGCDRGVVLAGSGRHTVMNVTATAGADTGFMILGSGNKLIQNTSAGNANDGFRAATALPPLSDVFIGNVAANNGDEGFDITGDRTSLTGNIAVGNGSDGIRIVGDDNKIARNHTYDNGLMGVIASGERNHLTLNTNVGNNGTGLGVYGAAAKVKSNVSIANLGNGIVSNATGSMHSRNNSVLNGLNGIDLFGSELQVSGSAAVLNGTNGFRTNVAGTNIVLKGNRAASNGAIGFDIDSGSTTVKSNLGYDNFTDDADDNSSLCSTNTWSSNIFGTTADACIE